MTTISAESLSPSRCFGHWYHRRTGIADEKYMSLTTFRTAKVTVQPSDSRGRVKAGTEPIEATAELVTGDELTAITTKIKEKYGFFTKITKLLGTIGGIVKRNRIPYADRGVVVTLPTES